MLALSTNDEEGRFQTDGSRQSGQQTTGRDQSSQGVNDVPDDPVMATGRAVNNDVTAWPDRAGPDLADER